MFFYTNKYDFQSFTLNFYNYRLILDEIGKRNGIFTSAHVYMRLRTPLKHNEINIYGPRNEWDKIR
jgi:hypothetical protein